MSFAYILHGYGDLSSYRQTADQEPDHIKAGNVQAVTRCGVAGMTFEASRCSRSARTDALYEYGGVSLQVQWSDRAEFRNGNLNALNVFLR